jgi:hypothetical protein
MATPHPSREKGRDDHAMGERFVSSNEKDVYLYLRDVNNGIFVKYDWIFLPDRILFVRMAGIGGFVSKNVLTRYASIIGEKEATVLINRLRDLRRRKSSSISEQDARNLLAVEARNSEIRYDDVRAVIIRKGLFGRYSVTIVTRSGVRQATITARKLSNKTLVLYFRARIGPRLLEC